MKNDKNTITPNEINKYLYCPYQWYYERFYGRKEINELYKERNKKLKLDDKTYSNFKKGVNFHNAYYIKHESLKFIKKIIIVCALLMLIYAVTKLKV